jgi:hypothetical protein
VSGACVTSVENKLLLTLHRLKLPYGANTLTITFVGFSPTVVALDYITLRAGVKGLNPGSIQIYL